MADFVKGDCHKCKYETSAECVPRSQKMGFPNCYQSTTTNADHLRSMTDEELAEWLNTITAKAQAYGYECADSCPNDCPLPEDWLLWLKEEAK